MASKHPRHVRKRLWVDPKVQGALLARVTLYWLSCVAATALLLFGWHALTGRADLSFLQLDEFWFHYGPVLVASLLTLPLVLLDLLRVSHRFVGPLLRLRRSMRQLARGERVEPITLRDGDFWHDFAQEFNAMLAKVQRPQRTANPQTHRSETPESLVEVG